MGLKTKITNIISNIKKYFAPFLLVSSLVFFISFAESENANKSCSGVEIILPGNKSSFVSVNEIQKAINSQELINQELKKINYANLESTLDGISYIKKAEVFNNLEGKLYVKVDQRKPVFRVFNKHGESFYVDEDGFKFPVSNHYTAHVWVAIGNINEKLDDSDTINTKVLNEIFKLTSFLESKTEYAALTGHIEVNQERDLVIIPRIGNHKIIIGNSELLDEKFRKLVAFYQKAAPIYGWNTYKSLNLKYKNQIIANK